MNCLRASGVDLAHVTLSHTDRKPDVAYHRDILQSGVRVEFDSAFRWTEGNPTLDLLVALAPDFPDQLMLGMDAARRSYWKQYGGKPGMSFLLTDFRPQLRESRIDGEPPEENFCQHAGIRLPVQFAQDVINQESLGDFKGGRFPD